MLKRDKMIDCGVSGCTNRADKNSNIIRLVIIIILLKPYRDLFRTLAYLMPEAYSKPRQIRKMMQHIESPGILRKIYSDIFRHIQQYLHMFRHIEGH